MINEYVIIIAYEWLHEKWDCIEMNVRENIVETKSGYRSEKNIEIG